MAVGSFQEVLRLFIETGGKGDVESLAKGLEQLQAVSAGASKEAPALVEKLKSMAATAGQIQAYTRLKAAIFETNAELAKERGNVERLRFEMNTAEKPTA